MKKIIYVALISSLTLLLFITQSSPVNSQTAQTGFVVGHQNTDLSAIPEEWITQAKSDLHIAYNHTSHGSQLIRGLNALAEFPSFGTQYAWTNHSQGSADSLSLDDLAIPGIPDLSQGDIDSDGDGVADWAEVTYDFLEDPNNYHINVVIWSWCDIAGHDIPRYLNSMEWLIAQFGEGGTHARAAAYPVNFVFMTAHANGGGENDSSDTPNKQIRAHVAAHNRILFDFSDLENYDPDGNYYLDKLLQDDLDYDSDGNGSRDANWAVEYLVRHDDGELDRLTTGDNVAGYSGVESCAHSDAPNEARLNCVLKGRAAWYLFARLAGWDGGVAPGGEVEMMASTSTAVYNDPITYTINIRDIPAITLMTDSLPGGLTYIPGSLSATTGVVTDTAPVLQWTGDLNGPSEVTITFAATVNVTGAQAVTNTATVTAEGYEPLSATATVIANGNHLYLPAIVR